MTAARRALSDAEPGAVIISGPAGVGRTRLAQEVLASMRASGRRTEWVTGTRPTAAMQLDALGHLVGAVAGEDSSGAWQALSTRLSDEHGRGPVVLAIDDAHLLNDLCASLVHKLTITRTATVVLTVRGDAPAPDLINALWRDGLAPRVELTPLTYEHVEQLLTLGLGNTVDSRTCHELWQASRGSAVFLHELVEAGRSTDRLRRIEGMWRWCGELTPTSRLRAVVLAQAGELSPAEQAAVDLLAVGGVLELQDLVALNSPEVVAGLERRGIVSVDVEGRRPIARLAQPLLARVLCDQMPETLAAQFRQQLATAPSVQRWAREDPLRVAPLLLQPGFETEAPRSRARAAVQANAASDHELAEQLARTALDDGPDIDALIALAEALRWQGRHEEAERVATEATRLAVSEHDGQRLATTRMLNVFYGSLSYEGAEVVGKEARTDAPGAAGSPVDVLAAVLRLAAGDPTAAAEICDLPPSIGADDECLQLWKTAAATVGNAFHGRPERSGAAALRGWAALDGCEQGTETAFARALLMQGEVLALGLAGRVPEAETRAAALHRATLGRHASACDAIAALGRGTAALLAGRPLEAHRWLTEAAVQATEGDPLRLLSVCRALQAQAAALRGDPVAAGVAAEQSDQALRPAVFEPVRLLAHAWTAAAQGRTSDAVDLAQRAATSARAMDQRAVEANALHASVRLGRSDAVLPRLRQLADELDTPMVRGFAVQAEAAMHADGARLDQLATEFDELGAYGLAADAAAQAAEAHRGAGHRRSASASAARAIALAGTAGGVRTPALTRLAAHTLTHREGEIAALAARGASNTEIARRLVLSVRTIETHLGHVYDKLGINGRGALHDAMAAVAVFGAAGSGGGALAGAAPMKAGGDVAADGCG